MNEDECLQKRNPNEYESSHKTNPNKTILKQRILAEVDSSNPWESNHRDGPMGHKNIFNKNERRCRDVKTQKACEQG